MLHEAHLTRIGNKNDCHKNNTNSSSSSSSSRSSSKENQYSNTLPKHDIMVIMNNMIMLMKPSASPNAGPIHPVRYGLKSRAALDVAERHVLALHSKLVAREFHRIIQDNDTPRACSACKS